jgi:hypothetical protein
MNKKKGILIGGLAGGITYAGMMAGFDYFDGENFRTMRFLVNIIFFGSFMGYLVYYSFKKGENKNY